MNSCLFDSGHNTNNQLTAERTAVYSTLVTNRITNLNEQLFIRFWSQICLFASGHNTNNHLTAERTAVIRHKSNNQLTAERTAVYSLLVTI